jgi:hypothetical protein
MVATKDQMIPRQAEEFMAQRMGATMHTVPSSHAAMVSHPKEVTDLIVSAAESTGKPAKNQSRVDPRSAVLISKEHRDTDYEQLHTRNSSDTIH